MESRHPFQHCGLASPPDATVSTGGLLAYCIFQVMTGIRLRKIPAENKRNHGASVPENNWPGRCKPHYNACIILRALTKTGT
jgi:hypothetical protein